MDKKEKIEQEIRKTLDQFEQAVTLPANPYFHTRVRQRLEEQTKTKRTFSAILKPALLMALVVLNLVTAGRYFSGSESSAQTDTRKRLGEILAGDLNLDNKATSLFLIE